MNVTFQYACFGCAGVVGRVLGLDEEKMVHAMGLAYSQTAGNSQNLLEGTLATRFSQGLAAQAGVYAAVFARRGITAAREVLEGKFGYYPVYQRGEYDVRSLLEGLGERFEGVNVTLKKYPCCMHSHAASMPSWISRVNKAELRRRGPGYGQDQSSGLQFRMPSWKSPCPPVFPRRSSPSYAAATAW
jgi:hypothetical protein